MAGRRVNFHAAPLCRLSTTGRQLVVVAGAPSSFSGLVRGWSQPPRRGCCRSVTRSRLPRPCSCRCSAAVRFGMGGHCDSGGGGSGSVLIWRRFAVASVAVCCCRRTVAGTASNCAYAMLSDSECKAALATCRTFAEALGERRVGSVKLELVKRILSCIETFSTDNNNLSWHVHVSGFDKSGRLFWIPIHKDDTVCDSPAAHVLGMVYRFAESATCMQALAPSILAGSAGAALDSLLPTLRADHDGGSLIDGPLPVCDSDSLVLSRLQSAPRAATARGAGPLLPPGAERPHSSAPRVA